MVLGDAHVTKVCTVKYVVINPIPPLQGCTGYLVGGFWMAMLHLLCNPCRLGKAPLQAWLIAPPVSARLAVASLRHCASQNPLNKLLNGY